MIFFKDNQEGVISSINPKIYILRYFILSTKSNKDVKVLKAVRT